MAERRGPRRRRATPARSRARCSAPPPVLRARARHRAQRRRRGGSTTLYPRTACRCMLEELDLDRHADVDAARRRLPARRRRAGRWPSCASAGVRVVDLSADFRLRDRGRLRGLVRRARRARAARRRRVYGLPELLPRARSRAPTSSPTPAATRPRRCSALAPLARAGLIGDVVIDAKSGVSGRRPRADADDALRHGRRERQRRTGSPRHRHTPEIEQELAALGATCAITFMPHLLPLDQGELVSCYVTPRDELGEDELRDAVRRRLRAASRSSSSRDGPPGVRDVRETNFCRISVHRDERTGRVHRVRRDRQPVEGRGVAGGAEPQPDVRAPTRRRGCVSGVFGSRWIERAGARRPSVDPAACPRASARRASRAGSSQRRARPRPARLRRARRRSSAARFTRSGVLAAPVLLCQERCAARRAARGGRQLRQRQRRDRPPRARGRRADAGRRARWPRGVRRGSGRGRLDRRDRRAAATRRGHPGHRRRARASCAPTATRTSPRRSAPPTRSPSGSALDVALAGGTVRLTAQAKGAGMISPRFATMLCFVQTDAALAPETADLLLGVCVKRSFDRIRVDGQLSTNDTVILHGVRARPACAVEPETEDELRFGEALDALLRQLALLIVRDGEGARRVGRVVVRGGHEPTVGAPSRARSPNSPLVKAALHGGDPNWGRIAQAVGARAARHARRCRSTSRSRACRCAARGAAVPLRRRRRWRRRSPATRSSTTIGAARRGRRGRGLLLRPRARVRDDQRGVHDVSDDARRRHAARGAPVHPGVPRQDRRDQVRRRGDDRPGAARGVRARRRAAQVRRAEPDRRPRRRAGDHRATWSGSTCRSSSSTACACPTPTTVEVAKMVLVGKVNKDIVLRINRHGQPAVGLCGDDGLLFRVRDDGRRRAARTSASSGGSSASTSTCSTTSPRTTSRSSRPSAPTARATRTTSTPTRRRGAVARALGAYKVMFLTDVRGLAARPGRPGSR